MRDASNLIFLYESDLLKGLNGHLSPEKFCQPPAGGISPGLLRSQVTWVVQPSIICLRMDVGEMCIWLSHCTFWEWHYVLSNPMISRQFNSAFSLCKEVNSRPRLCSLEQVLKLQFFLPLLSSASSHSTQDVISSWCISLLEECSLYQRTETFFKCPLYWFNNIPMILSLSTARAAATHFSKHFTFSPHASERALGLACWPVASQFAVYLIMGYSHFKPNPWNKHVLCRHSSLGLSSTSMVINISCAFFAHHYLKLSWQPNASSDLSMCRDRSLEQILLFGTNVLYCVGVLIHNWEL